MSHSIRRVHTSDTYGDAPTVPQSQATPRTPARWRDGSNLVHVCANFVHSFYPPRSLLVLERQGRCQVYDVFGIAAIPEVVATQEV